VRAALAECRWRLGLLHFSAIRYDEALPLYRLARADLESLAAAPEATADLRRSLADTVSLIGALLDDTGKKSEAEVETRKALALRQKLAEDNPAVAEFRRRLSISHSNLAFVLRTTGRPSEALAEEREGLAFQQKLADDNPAVTEFRSNLAIGHNNLSMLLLQMGEPSEAEAEIRKSLPLLQKLADDNAAVTIGDAATYGFRGMVANGQNNLGWLLIRTGKPAEAEAELRQSLAISQKLADDNPKSPEYRDMIAMALTNVGDVARKLGREAEARDGYDRAIALRERLIAEHPARTLYRGWLAWSLRRRGLARRALGDPAGAATDARRALSLFEGLPSRSSEDLFEEGCCHAALAALAGRDGAGVSAAEGKAEADRAMALLRKTVGHGYRDASGLRTDSALDPFREREDFKKLLGELERPSPAKPEK
jgi:eukaryotic-like serine/threonine-protein kinase